MKKIKYLLLSLLLVGCTKTQPVVTPVATSTPIVTTTPEVEVIAIDTECDDYACVALYLETYETLPGNYMTKREARELGWSSGALHLVVEGKCIGGDVFGNREGILPEDNVYHECDIDTLSSKTRGSKRIVYSEDGDIWYTEDHYETFTLLAGEGK